LTEIGVVPNLVAISHWTEKMMAHVTSPDTPRRPRADVIARRMGRTGVLVDLKTSRIFELNNTAARVWELLRSSHTPSQIVSRLAREFSVDEMALGRELSRLLGQLDREGLLEP
jgi:hypothetical protein